MNFLFKENILEKDPLSELTEIRKRLAYSEFMIVSKGLYSYIVKGGSLYNGIYNDVLLLVISVFNLSSTALHVVNGLCSIVDIVILTITFLFIIVEVLISHYCRLHSEDYISQSNANIEEEVIALHTGDEGDYESKEIVPYEEPSIVSLLSKYGLSIKLTYIVVSLLLHILGIYILIYR